MSAMQESLVLDREQSHFSSLEGIGLSGTRYSIERQVAMGGMGLIFEVRDNDLGRTLAVKTLREDWRDEDSIIRFIAEARSIGRLQHPNILPVHELKLDDRGIPYYTMPLVEGLNLAQIIEKLRSGDLEFHRDYTFARRLNIVIGICEALDFAHKSGFIHRDIKPENVMVGPFGEVFLMDWGLTASSEEAQEPNQIVGTPGFIAPEVIRSQPATPASDVYSLGCLMYELFTLREAHPGATPNVRLFATLEKKPRYAWMVHARGQGPTPREISQLISHRVLLQEPEKRLSVAAIRQEISDYINGQAPVTCTCTGAKRATNLFLKLIDRFGLVAVFFGFLWLVSPFVLLWLLLHP